MPWPLGPEGPNSFFDLHICVSTITCSPKKNEKQMIPGTWFHSLAHSMRSIGEGGQTNESAGPVRLGWCCSWLEIGII